MEDMDQPVEHGTSGKTTIGISMHCANDCTAEYNVDTDLYNCGWRHWCPWCGDCEYCYEEGPHEWD
jgi:hypothetical protein